MKVYYNKAGIMLRVLLPVMLIIGLVMNGQTAFAADDNTVRIYIGNDTDARHRCADNKETGYEYDKKLYDNLMKNHQFYKKINANGIEMMLQAVDKNTGVPVSGSQCFKSYGKKKISDVIRNHKDYQKDHD